VSHRTWRERLEDILVCVRNIQSFTTGMTFSAFLEDPKTIRAVAFELTTIGEAVRTMPLEIQERYPNVPWGKMQGIRNVLVHEYFRLDEEILWETSQVDATKLAALLETILSES